MTPQYCTTSWNTSIKWMDLLITLVQIPPFSHFSGFELWMDTASCSYGTSHRPDGCTCTLLQGQQLQQGLQYLSRTRPVLQLTGPTVTMFTTPFVHFPTSQSGTDVSYASHDHQNLQWCYELHDHYVYLQPISNCLSDSHLHLPPQSFQFHFPSLNGQINEDSEVLSASTLKVLQVLKQIYKYE